MWPLVIGGYSGAALAFTTALFWDRHSRLQDEVRQTEAERRRSEERLQQEQERRVVEAKRRFGALELELTRLKASIERTKREQHNYKHFFPDLPDRLVGGRERAARRDRLRLRADGRPRDVLRPRRGAAVAAPLQGRRVGRRGGRSTRSSRPSSARWPTPSTSLLEQVREQIDEPAGRADRRRAAGQRPTRVARTRQFTGAIRAQTPEEIAKALATQSLPGLEGSPTAPDGSA